jgi:hypothetical protein
MPHYWITVPDVLKDVLTLEDSKIKALPSFKMFISHPRRMES